MQRIKTAAVFSKFGPDKRLFVLMLVVTVTITIDSEIGYVADFIPEQLSSNTGVFVFILIAVIFVVTQYLILDYVKHLNKETRQRVPHLSKLHSGVFFAQYLFVGIIVVVISRILLMQQYNIISLYIVYAVSYGLWIVTLALLARAFFLWYKFSKNTMILIFTLSMIAYVINGITGLAEYSDMLGQQKNIISSTDIAYFPEFSIESVKSQLGVANTIASTTAYILTWVGTVKMLFPYIKKLGKIKFWIIMGVAMIYYLSVFPLFILGYFTPSENADAMTIIIIFSLAGLLSGIIFGAAFYSVARTLRGGSDLRNHMIVAAYGFVLFYIAGSATASQAAYPPFGMVSVSFIGLSCYLIYTGLYSSAVTVSQDTTLRLSIKKSITDQAKFLHGMGSAHMEQELQSTVIKIAKKNSDVLTEKTGVKSSMTEIDIKEYMAMVMDEIHKT
ncbi:MAG TPA: hypothetical protein VIA08_04505 [Nitrososphaeraceae archaeon]